MNFTLNDMQMQVLKEVADAEMRSTEQMLSILLAEGISFYYCDYHSPSGTVDEVGLANIMTRNAKFLAKSWQCQNKNHTMTTFTSVMQSIAGYTTLEKIINGTPNIKNSLSVKSIYHNRVQQDDARKLMKLQNSSLKEYEYTQIDGQVRYLLAPDLEHAAWAAAELSGGSRFLKNVKQTDEW